MPSPPRSRRLPNLEQKGERPARRVRIALVWPRLRSCGVVLAVVDNNVLYRLAVGTVPCAGVGTFLDTFGTEGVYLPDAFKYNIQLGVGVTPHLLWYKGSTTSSYPLPPELRKVSGHLAKKAWSMALHNWWIKGPYSVRKFDVAPLTTTWVEQHRRGDGTHTRSHN